MRCKYRTKRVYTILNNTKLEYKDVPFNQLFKTPVTFGSLCLKYKGKTKTYNIATPIRYPENVWITENIKRNTLCTIVIDKKLHKKMVKGIEDLFLLGILE